MSDVRSIIAAGVSTWKQHPPQTLKTPPPQDLIIAM